MLGRWLSLALLVAGLTLLAVATFSYLSFSGGPAVAAEEPDLTLEEVNSGQDVPFVFRLRNDSWRPVRVVGLAPC